MQVVGQVNRIAVKRAVPGNGWPLTLAPASLGIGLRAVAVYPPSAIGIGQPQGFLVEAQPTPYHRRPSYPRTIEATPPIGGFHHDEAPIKAKTGWSLRPASRNPARLDAQRTRHGG